MDRLKIDKTVIFTIEGLIRDFTRCNDEIAEAVSKYPDRLIGFATVNPWLGDEAVQELERAVGKLGLKGLKLHPYMQGFPAADSMLFPIMEKATKLQIPVLFHSGTPPWSEPLQVAALAERFPDVPVILGHFGQNMYGDTIRALKMVKNLYGETSANHFVYAIEKAIREVGAHRILYGSDMPWLEPEPQLIKIKILKITDEERELVLGNNMARILRIA